MNVWTPTLPTEVMHGGATTAFALVALTILERDDSHGLPAVRRKALRQLHAL